MAGQQAKMIEGTAARLLIETSIRSVHRFRVPSGKRQRQSGSECHGDEDRRSYL
jgi:hypothetical protein